MKLTKLERKIACTDLMDAIKWLHEYPGIYEGCCEVISLSKTLRLFKLMFEKDARKLHKGSDGKSVGYWFETEEEHYNICATQEALDRRTLGLLFCAHLISCGDWPPPT